MSQNMAKIVARESIMEIGKTSKIPKLTQMKSS